MRRWTVLLGVLGLLGLLGACGDDGAPGGPVDAPAVPDDSPPDCGLSTDDFGSLGARPGVATWNGPPGRPGAGLGELFIPLEDDPEPDQLYVSLWGDTQIHPDLITAGTYPLTGSQLQLSTCSVCVTIGANWAPGAPAPLDHAYLATGGTVVISKVDGQPGGAFEISFSDLTFGHVRIVGGASTQLDDGCVTALADVSFSGSFEP